MRSADLPLLTVLSLLIAACNAESGSVAAKTLARAAARSSELDVAEQQTLLHASARLSTSATYSPESATRRLLEQIQRDPSAKVDFAAGTAVIDADSPQPKTINVRRFVLGAAAGGAAAGGSER